MQVNIHACTHTNKPKNYFPKHDKLPENVTTSNNTNWSYHSLCMCSSPGRAWVGSLFKFYYPEIRLPAAAGAPLWNSTSHHYFLLAFYALLSFPCCGVAKDPVLLAAFQGPVWTDRCHFRSCYVACVMYSAWMCAAFLAARAHLSDVHFWGQRGFSFTELVWRGQAHAGNLPILRRTNLKI